MPFAPVNSFLRSLSERTVQDIASEVKFVEMPVETSIFNAGETPRYVHFIESGIASIVTDFSEGESIEVGIVGSDSFPEKLSLLGMCRPNSSCYTQISGYAYRMAFSEFQRRFLSRPDVSALVMKHAQADWLTSLQLIGCAKSHEIEARLARWLLMVADHVGDEIKLTQEFLAYMLGCRRSSVTLTAGSMQRAGLITYTRGHINIQDRQLLEQAACECYQVCSSFRKSLLTH